ncbi:MAG: hypothetical protein AMJ62_14525 [Myxococcales bacterium SG8_38]|nr:MAG: hypothetical protein AMJ62_14525 [Myxococcales bacterium SG8_38]
MDREAPIARMVREAIETVATPEVRVQILHRALHMAREHEVPHSGEALRAFVRKHLRTAMAFYLGEDATEAVMQNLEPLVALAEKTSSAPPKDKRRPDDTRRLGRERQRSGLTRKETPSPAETDTSKYPTVQPLGSALPMVFVATRSAERCRQIQKHIGGRAAVQQIGDVVAFLDNLKATASLSPLVVIDCVEASVQPSTIATLSHELPESSAVLIWGATEQHRDLTDLAAGDEGWLRCGVEATPSDVAALIHMLLGE